MKDPELTVRELTEADITPLTNYWLSASAEFLTGMGVDLSKMPAREQWHDMLNQQLQQSYPEKQSYGMIWLLDGMPIGHSNVNKIIFGEEGYMHLHIWDTAVRKMGYGNAFIRLTIPYFFRNLQLKNLYCEPYALNPAPNRTLEKAGFQFLREYITIPGWLNFEQPVKLWVMSLEEFSKMG